MRESLSAVEKRSRTQREILEPVLVDVLQSSLTSHVSGPGALSCLCGEGMGWLPKVLVVNIFPCSRLWSPKAPDCSIVCSREQKGKSSIPQYVNSINSPVFCRELHPQFPGGTLRDFNQFLSFLFYPNSQEMSAMGRKNIYLILKYIFKHLPLQQIK